MAQWVFLALLHLIFTLTILVHAQNQADFISLDCGLMHTTSYTGNITGITYQSDRSYTDSGVSYSISSEHRTDDSLERQFWNVRSFPEGNRNCYSFHNSSPEGGKQYLIRARFMYANYDGENFLPNFDIYLGTMWWDTVEFDNSSSIVTKEVIYNPQSAQIHVCLSNINKGTPFISVLELRFLHLSPYGQVNGLVHFARLDIGSQDGKIVRYPHDPYDRIWTPYNSINWTRISTSYTIDVKSDDYTFPPSNIMRTAATPANDGDCIYLQLKYDAFSYLVYLHFAEFEPNQVRTFDIIVNGGVQNEAFQPSYRKSEVVQQGNDTNADKTLEVWIKRSNGSALPPILNAIEIYTIKGFSLQVETDPTVYNAINKIKSYYGIKRNWHGDPCIPKTYMWEGVNCTTVDGFDAPKITSLSLSSQGLTGIIAEDIEDMKWLEYLDLSHNKLSGPVPEFLYKLYNLKVLKLDGNNLSGTIPPDLLERSKNGLLFSCHGNPNLMCHRSCCKKRGYNKMVISLVASFSGAFILFAAITFWMFKRRQQHKAATILNKPSFEFPLTKVIDSNKQQFTYAEVKRITNNFGRELGKGGFGTVYHGSIGSTQVAIKLLSPSAQVYQQFQSEAELLTRVHHKCLTALIGYCEEGTNMALIYEYMANGDLADQSGKNGRFLSWKQRLQIAVDAAEGLEYLHNGCKPPIVHRDIKPQNILLNENMRAKLADFGLSRIYSDEADTHVSTVIADTLGYLDPEYFMTNRLNEKSDVFSFGVVLLEIVTGHPAIAKSEKRTHITRRFESMSTEGEIQKIVDPRLHGEFSIESARKFLNTAMACVAPTSMDRPTMSQVVIELKQCLGMVMTLPFDSHATLPDYSIDVSFDMISGESSLAR